MAKLTVFIPRGSGSRVAREAAISRILTDLGISIKLESISPVAESEMVVFGDTDTHGQSYDRVVFDVAGFSQYENTEGE